MSDSSAPSEARQPHDAPEAAEAAMVLTTASSKPFPSGLWPLAAVVVLELLVLAPLMAYKLVVWTSFLDDKHISPYIFSWLSLAGFVFVLVRALQYIFTHNPKGFAYCQLFLMLHTAAAFIGVGSGLFLHVMHGESLLSYQIMGSMAAVAIFFGFASRKFKNSRPVRHFFEQPTVEA